MPITRLLLVLEVWDGKPTYRKSWAGNLLVWSDLTLGPSLKVKWGQPNLKVLITRLLLVLDVWDGKPTYRKPCAGNLLAWSDLTLGPSLKVKWGQPNLKVLITRLLLVLEVLVHCLYGGCNLHRFSDALDLVFNALKFMESCTESLITWKVLHLEHFVKICYSTTFFIATK